MIYECFEPVNNRRVFVRFGKRTRDCCITSRDVINRRARTQGGVQGVYCYIAEGASNTMERGAGGVATSGDSGKLYDSLSVGAERFVVVDAAVPEGNALSPDTCISKFKESFVTRGESFAKEATCLLRCHRRVSYVIHGKSEAC